METNTMINKDYILQRSPKESPNDFTFVYGNPRFGIINESDGEMELGRTVACHELGHISPERMEEYNKIPLDHKLPDSDRFNYERLSKEGVNGFLNGYYFMRHALGSDKVLGVKR